MIRCTWRPDHRVSRWSFAIAGVGYYALVMLPRLLH